MTFLKKIEKINKGKIAQLGRAFGAPLRKLSVLSLIFLVTALGIPIPQADSAITIKPQNIVATGGTITTVTLGNTVYKVHTFTSTGSDTFRVTKGSGKVWYLVVAGGGGGGRAQATHGGSGGGGSGGYLSNAAYNYAVTAQAYSITVGGGGAGATVDNTNGTNGSNSLFDTITSTGGGGGAGPANSGNGSNGGSGGGGPQTTGAGGTGAAGQGNAGATRTSNFNSGQGGGGAGAIGNPSTGGPNTAGAGGVGMASSISGAAVTYAGGGGGGRYLTDGGGAGGSGGGGAGAVASATGTAGTANTGGGGGGGSGDASVNGSGGAGGSGIVIIRYPIGSAKAVTSNTIDPYWGNVVLLTGNDNKASSTTSFIDQSISANPLTAVGNTQYTTAQAPTGMSSSIALDGTGDQISFPSSSATAFGADDVTFEGWFRFSSVGNMGFWNKDDLGANRNFSLFKESGIVYARTNTQSTIGAWSPSTNTWYHLALTISSGTGRFFVDGTQVGSNFTASSIPNGSNIFQLFGYANAAGADVAGWAGPQRITKGIARYTTTFTPPTLPLPTKGTGVAAALKPASPKASPITATGGTITTVTTNGVTRKVHTFTSSDTFQVTSGKGKVQYLVVAGGGGAAAGGGGAGGFKTNGTYDYQVIKKSYTVTVGNGGTGLTVAMGNNPGLNGSDSVFDTITSTGGGGGGNATTNKNGSSGGSGGGGGSTSSGTGTGGTATPSGQGNSGGSTGGFITSGFPSGGGGGAGSVGGDAVSTSVSGAGGSGRASSISGVSVFYAGGGGGGTNALGTSGAGGVGGGGAGSTGFGGSNGTANTGGGGGGADAFNAGGNGGSGVVIVSYITTKEVASKNAPAGGLVGWWPFDSSAQSTSANVTWSPTDKDTSMDLTNSNLTATRNGGAGNTALRNSLGKSSGKWYWEITGLWTVSAASIPVIGVADSTASLQQIIGGNANGWGYRSYDGKSFNNSGTSAYGATYTTGDVIGVALNMDAGTLTFYKNGTSQGQAFSGLTGALYPTASLYTQNDTVTANFGATAFTYSPPSGYKGLVYTSTGDRSGRVNTGTLIQGPTSVTGKLGQALNFNGSTQYVDAGTGISVPGEVTAAAWIKLSSTAGGTAIVIVTGTCCSGQLGLEVNRTAGKLASITRDFSTGIVVTGSTTLTTGIWYHVASVISGSTGAWTHTLYVNGISDGSATSSINAAAGPFTTNIGRLTNGVFYFPGSIDDVRAYNRALSAAEVFKLYKSR